jgi:hypothetical protein
MKLSEIARYWAAKELTRIERDDGQVTLNAPFASPRFTVRLAARGEAPPKLAHGPTPIPLDEVAALRDLESGTWLREEGRVTVCFDLPKGELKLGV